MSGRISPAIIEAGQHKSRGREPRVLCGLRHLGCDTLNELTLCRELQMDVTEAVVCCSGFLLSAGSALEHSRALDGMSLKTAPLCPAVGDAQELQSLHAISLTLASRCQQNFKVSRAAVRGTQCDYNLTSSSRCMAGRLSEDPAAHRSGPPHVSRVNHSRMCQEVEHRLNLSDRRRGHILALYDKWEHVRLSASTLMDTMGECAATQLVSSGGMGRGSAGSAEHQRTLRQLVTRGPAANGGAGQAAFCASCHRRAPSQRTVISYQAARHSLVFRHNLAT